MVEYICVMKPFAKRIKKLLSGGTYLSDSLTMAKNRKIFMKELILMLMLLVDFICAYGLVLVWQEYNFYYVIIIVSSLFAGIVSANFSRSIIYVIVLAVIGAVIATGINILPPIMYGEDPSLISTMVFGYAQTLVKLLLIGLPLCIFLAIMGSFLGESIEMRD
jgi:hypothetical protein